jgi:hypothetical protein
MRKNGVMARVPMRLRQNPHHPPPCLLLISQRTRPLTAGAGGAPLRSARSGAEDVPGPWTVAVEISVWASCRAQGLKDASSVSLMLPPHASLWQVTDSVCNPTAPKLGASQRPSEEAGRLQSYQFGTLQKRRLLLRRRMHAGARNQHERNKRAKPPPAAHSSPRDMGLVAGAMPRRCSICEWRSGGATSESAGSPRYDS